jgi:transcriptional regulator with XRE-family HTH domain
MYITNSSKKMSRQGGKTKTQNRLWLARKRRGLGQKQVAYLLDKNVDEISRYERGIRIPSLETVLGLELIYGIPARLLFKDVYEQLQAEISARTPSQEVLKAIYPEASAEGQLSGEYCSYQEILNLQSGSAQERSKVRDHITKLAKKLAGL